MFRQFLLPVLAMAMLGACTTDLDRKMKPIESFEKHLNPKIAADSLPDSLANHLYQFAIAYPKHQGSENYLYAATLLAERGGRSFETAKWCEAFVAHYPKSKWVGPATVAAAHNFEKTGNFEKALKYYEMAAAREPNTVLGKQCAQMAKMIRLGLVTPEQQLEYITGQSKDSTVPVR